MYNHEIFNSKGNYNYNATLFENVACKPHFHKNIELLYVVEGQILFHVGDREQIMQTGDFAMVLPNEIHGATCTGDSLTLAIVFSSDFVPIFEKQIRGKIGSDFVFRCQEDVETLIKTRIINITDPAAKRYNARSMWVSKIPQDQPPLLMRKACLYAVCSEYLRQIELKELTEKSGILMRAITDFISVNYRSKITLADVARELGYNYHYLSKCFHQIFNMSFTELLNSYRLDEAAAMLVETDMDITQVALESGFQSIRSFNDFFKTQLGMTPSKYRSEFAKNRKNNL